MIEDQRAELDVTITRAESPRFAHPLLLIHGPWTGSWLWGRMAGYLGHRGWESWAIDRAGGHRPAEDAQTERLSVTEIVERCVKTVTAMDATPILVAHDAGAVVALDLAAAVEPPAIVLISPVLPGYAARRALLGGVGRAAAALLGWRLGLPEGPAAAALFHGTDAATAALIQSRVVDENGRFLYDLLRGSVPRIVTARRLPALVVSGGDDVVVPPAVAHAVASDLGGSVIVLSGGHWLPVEDGWRETIGQVHRWIVHTLGDPLLLFREETEDDEEGTR
jgi:pimeloyl-ACP methyl ester carboxylesterase